MLISCYSISDFVALKYATIRVQKLVENAKERVEDSVNGASLSKTVSNKFITVENVVFHVLISCYTITEFVALK